MTPTEGTNVSCSLPPADLQRRGQEVREGLGRRVLERRELDYGLAYRFAAEDENELREFVAFEQGCCGFAEFEIREADPGRALWLEIRGPKGTKDMFRGISDVAPSSAAARRDGFLRLGLAGGASAALVLLCCATPALPFLLGMLGLVSATSAIGFWVDALALPALGLCAAIVGWRLWTRRRPTSEAACDC